MPCWAVVGVWTVRMHQIWGGPSPSECRTTPRTTSDSHFSGGTTFQGSFLFPMYLQSVVSSEGWRWSCHFWRWSRLALRWTPYTVAITASRSSLRGPRTCLLIPPDSSVMLQRRPWWKVLGSLSLPCGDPMPLETVLPGQLPCQPARSTSFPPLRPGQGHSARYGPELRQKPNCFSTPPASFEKARFHMPGYA